MKKCNKCEIDKDESEFFKKRKTTFEGYCKKCKREKARINFDKNRIENLEKDRLRATERRKDEKWKQWRKNYYECNKDKINQSCRIYRLKNQEHLNKKASEWKERNRERVKEYFKNDRKRNPFKRAARSYTNAAIKEGILIRPKNCEMCMKECLAEAHHEDYKKPLDIKWLCRKCHGFIHRSF
jgi:hypothetical protein